jgi:hypothetical protein
MVRGIFCFLGGNNLKLKYLLTALAVITLISLFSVTCLIVVVAVATAFEMTLRTEITRPLSLIRGVALCSKPSADGTTTIALIYAMQQRKQLIDDHVVKLVIDGELSGGIAE